MSNYEAFLGRTYLEGQEDCYGLLRGYLWAVYQIDLPNYARPSRFWEDPRLDLYGAYSRHGFVQIFDRPLELGDVLLMPIRTPMNSHAVLLVDDNLILHHFPGKLSTVENLRPRWASRATVVLRHPEITTYHRNMNPPKQLHEVIDARLLQDPRIAERIETLMGSRG